jgi:hypothetical protein
LRHTIAIYANRFDSYNGQRFDVEPAAVTNPNGVMAQTHFDEGRRDKARLKLSDASE